MLFDEITYVNIPCLLYASFKAQSCKPSKPQSQQKLSTEMF